MIPSFGKIYNLGRNEVADIFFGKVILQEKIDGSQFSFMKDDEGTVHFRSKGAQVFAGEAGMFEKGCQAILERKDLLTPGIVYRGEYLAKPKHNVLAYDRHPKGHAILWEAHDLAGSVDSFADQATLQRYGEQLDLEVVPYLELEQVSLDTLTAALDQVSCLGGSKYEGIVVKNYSLFDRFTGLPLMAKHVSPRFKEVQSGEFRKENPTKQDVILRLVERYRSQARWHKAVQHLRDDGRLTDSPKDIGPLIGETMRDIQEECAEDIKSALYSWFMKNAGKALTKGLPEWYREQLLAKQFEE